MTKLELIQFLIEQHKYKRYLEIGVQMSKTFNEIPCETKVGVDKRIRIFMFDPKIYKEMDSDTFFETNKEKFDVILVDGGTEPDQVERDILNSVSCLNDNGIVLIKDTLIRPEMLRILFNVKYETFKTDYIPKEFREENGPKIEKSTRVKFNLWTVDVDGGVTIIKKMKEEDASIPVWGNENILYNKKKKENFWDNELNDMKGEIFNIINKTQFILIFNNVISYLLDNNFKNNEDIAIKSYTDVLDMNPEDAKKKLEKRKMRGNPDFGKQYSGKNNKKNS